ncbi:MAG TPA: hypothetical protein VFC78_17260 [Tepidisphaeraceae bacterium]|nr:hypothetical protein [Tepidisphaeraceae bacterium]
MTKAWKSYEEVAAHLLNQFAKEFGLDRVESKQKLRGHQSKTTWEADAKGVRDTDGAIMVVECKCFTTSRLCQGKIGELAYRIIDTGAMGGIIVSPLGLQEGARKVAKANNIVEVHLDENSTPEQFVMRFLNKIMGGFADAIQLKDDVTVEVIRRDS